MNICLFSEAIERGSLCSDVGHAYSDTMNYTLKKFKPATINSFSIQSYLRTDESKLFLRRDRHHACHRVGRESAHTSKVIRPPSISIILR